jgi:murein L,D-transpeptidase YcbB/YkuD
MTGTATTLVLRRLVAGWAIFLLMLLCSTCAATAQESDTVGSAIQDAVHGESASADWSQLQVFYAARDFRPVWTGGEAARARRALLLRTLRSAERHGLRSTDYTANIPAEPPVSAEENAIYDVALTVSFLKYAHDVRLGRLRPGEVYKDVDLPVQHYDAAASLADAVEEDAEDGDFGDFLKSLPPPHPEYFRLAEALAHYRGLAARGDEDAAQRVQQIEANMERWRWLPRHFEKRTIRVNVPDQSVTFVDTGEVRLRSKVVLGRKSMPTPILRTTAVAVIANPYWDIPDDIAAKSILPHLRHNPHYLESRNMVLADGPPDDPHGTEIDWKAVRGDNLPYQIRQQPGPDNGLGTVMLDMPNPFYVYLHGTPDQQLFTLGDREISHGCVRVEKILELGSLALSGSTTDSHLSDAVSGGTNQRMALDDPLPVYLLYWTAIPQPDGTVEFRPDLYGRDKALIEKLSGAERVSARWPAGGDAASAISIE